MINSTITIPLDKKDFNDEFNIIIYMQNKNYNSETIGEIKATGR